MRVFPLENCVYYRWDDLETEIKTKEGLTLNVGQGREAWTRKAVVLATGPLCKYLKPGDRVVISAFTGAHMFLVNMDMDDVREGEKLRIARESEFLALVDTTEARENEVTEAAKRELERLNRR